MEMHFVKGQENDIVLEHLRDIELPVLAWCLASREAAPAKVTVASFLLWRYKCYYKCSRNDMKFLEIVHVLK